jgi:hypothetical protein
LLSISVDQTNPANITFDDRSRDKNPYFGYQASTDDCRFGRSLSKSDIEGASPNKFKHRPRKYFVDRQEIKGKALEERDREMGWI